MSSKSLLSNTIFYSIGEILPRALGFILLPIYTAYLSPSEFGITTYINTVVAFLYVLGTFALNSYVLRFYFIHEKEEERKELLGTAYLAILFLNAVILLMALMVMPIIINIYNIQVPWNPYFKIAFFINFFDSFSIIPMVLYRIRQEAIKFVALAFSRTILCAALTLYFLIVEDSGLIGVFKAQLYVLIPYVFVYLKIMFKKTKWCVNWSYIKEGISYSAPLIPGSICYMLLSMSDRVILERNVSMEEIGIYNIACQMSLVLNIVIQSGYRSIEPELFRRYGHDGFYEFIRKTQSVFFAIVYIAAMLVSLFSQEVFYLMTTAPFHSGYKLVPALMVGVIMTGHSILYGGVLQGEKRTKYQGAATVVGAIVSVMTNLLLIPKIGIFAAAMASAVSFFVVSSMLFSAMTFPGKSMVKDILLIALVPIIAYSFFLISVNISILSIVMKIIVLSIYVVLIFKMMNVDVNHIKYLFNRN